MARMIDAGRWRALLGLLWSAAGWRVPLFGVLVLLGGLLPTAVLLATGALLDAVPGVARDGMAAGSPALVALAALVGGLVASSLVSHAMSQQAGVLDAALALEVHHTVARVTLETPGVAQLEDPAFADELGSVQDAERRGVLQQPVTHLSGVLATRLRGLGAFCVLLTFQWWAPLALAAAWQLTNLVYYRATERGLSARDGVSAGPLRRSEYLRSLAVDPAAAKEVRVFGLAGWTVARYGDAWLEALTVLWRNRRADRGLNAAAVCALAVSHGLVLTALAAAATRGDVSLAALFVFVQAVLATGDLGLVGDSQSSAVEALALSGRVAAMGRRLLPARADEAPRVSPAERGAVGVRLDGVRFTYRGRALPTLDGLTLHVPAGQSLAIVGENGAGKSTLIKLLCGLYEPDAGTVALDGGMTPVQARGRIAVIFQDFVRYRLPLRENVAFGHLPLAGDDAALAAALRDAGAGELLTRLPNGWDTVLSREFEGGADLSGGQWQRVALARALAAVRGGAGLLILDEPTAALDVRAETELFDRFLELTRGVTTILVSHRLSSVRRADRIVVVGEGRVVEDGSHDDLMRAGGRYARMYSLQARRFADDASADGEGAEEVAHA
ncbi:MAG TPA: ABC transporter ATP-binding protein [Longimicrobium sp.]|nr:ABC transporter ATP-binding protein [Longimicrobium sp.]